jgi:DNA polymerase
MGVPFKDVLVLDFETRYARTPREWCPDAYTLSKMTTEEYVRHPLFKAFGVSIQAFKHDATPAQWYGHDELPRIFGTYDWSRTAVVAHNAQFDVSILGWHYGIQPAFIFDTLSMSRALRGAKGRNSLDALAKDFGLPEKGTALGLSDGLMDLPRDIERKLAEYCNHDVWLCAEVFKRFLCMQAGPDSTHPGFLEYMYDPKQWAYPAKELRLIDMTLRMFTRPLLELDTAMLGEALVEEKETRERLLRTLNISDSDLASNDRFAAILRGLGIEPPVKKKRPTVKTPHPEGFNFAFAKNDAGFQALMAHEDDTVVTLCEARLKVKSTTERTRAQRFLDISHRGTLPVPLHYYGAATGRWAAAKGSAINMQNLKRKSFLRKAIMAPDGSVIVVVDLSQIEPRVLAWLSDYRELLQIFRSGQDVYAIFGSQMFNIPGLTKETHPLLRQSAKSALLGAGYGLGWASFAAQLLVGFLGAPPVRYDKAFAKALGVNAEYIQKFLDWEDNVIALNDIPHNCTKQELLIHAVASKKIIDIYRATAAPVKDFWNLMGELIPSALADGQEYNHKAALLFRKEEIVLPNGMSLRYPNLRQTKDDRGRPQWVYGPDATKLYPGKVTNNVTQALARIVMTDGLLRVSARIPLVGTVHDEGLGIVPEKDGPPALKWMIRKMTEEPAYLPGIPLAADGGFHRRYGMAKD